MNSNQEQGNEGPLQELLHDWVVETPLPPRFQEQVWHRIADRQAQAKRALPAVLADLIEFIMPRPKFAWTYVAVLLVLAAAGGSWAAQRQNGRWETTLSLRYIQSLDPYQIAPVQ